MGEMPTSAASRERELGRRDFPHTPFLAARSQWLAMDAYLVTHRHEPAQCGVAFAAWRGCESPLRHHLALSSCVEGGHSIWWRIEADSAEAALALVPPWIAARSEIAAVREIAIP